MSQIDHGLERDFDMGYEHGLSATPVEESWINITRSMTMYRVGYEVGAALRMGSNAR